MRDILFMGEILASVTHEMQNLMAIIKESGALAEDVLALNGSPALKHGDKLTAALANIQEQVGRGRDLMLMINSFAHAAADYPDCSDLRRFARQMCTLAGRMIHLKECTLVQDLNGPPLPVRCNALMLMQSVYLGLCLVLDTCKAGDALRVSVTAATDAEKTGGSHEAVLTILADRSDAVPATDRLEAVMAELGGACRARGGSLALHFPAAPFAALAGEAFSGAAG